VVTAGGLIFIAAATDDLIKAIDIKTGEILWSDVLPAGGQATPVTAASERAINLAAKGKLRRFRISPSLRCASMCFVRFQFINILAQDWGALLIQRNQPFSKK
jgi:hypothetical protein